MEPTQGICPHCSFVNSKEWILCDACNERLPWAPPEKPKPKIDEMTDEQLSVLFTPPPQRERPFWSDHPGLGRIMMVVIGVLVFSLYNLLFRR